MIPTHNPFIPLEPNIKANCKNLRSIHVAENVDLHFAQSMVNAIGDQLEALYITDASKYNITMPTNGWKNLQELTLWLPTPQQVNGYFSSISNIKRVIIAPRDMRIETYKSFMEPLITNEFGLELLWIWIPGAYLKLIMAEIEESLFKCKDKERSEGNNEFTLKITSNIKLIYLKKYNET